ncbi:GNAT family N-acetyltransferase [Dietzia sp. UBA5065]|uniref:GNAT family N-acetyltransferase n=1 Tax=Dietzia sp. UBA5065 TaxID=1946422 RepID=UPI0025BFFE68|nr:GNAT family N-acetyltransferase [Dietzia sp. UBA5065]HMT49981.1 GNAT family N-acetyltransferase [Dietzia sp.]
MTRGDEPSDHPDLRLLASPLAGLGPMDVHALYKLRVDVFVAEQECPYAEIDDVDADPGTTHLLAWTPGDAGEPDRLVATLRVFGPDDHGGAMHLGRVCTAPGWRGRGIAARLIRRGLALCGERPVEIGAQAHLEGWYERFGFVRSGEDYLDERIPHLPMRRDLLG